MARKSNKTAHVLNLLSGQQDSGGEPEKETQQPKAEAEAGTAEPEKEKKEAPPAPAAAKTQTDAVLEVPSNISIIDNGAKEADPLAEQIHNDLLKELEKEERAAFAAAEKEPEAETETPPAAEEPEAETESSPAAEETEDREEPPAPLQPEPEEEVIELSPEAKEEAAELSPEAKEEAAELSPETEEAAELSPETEEAAELSPEPPSEPEPDYVMLNVMQRVVEDKIIYFMKQFEVCTCDRCIADTIALTLSGLPAKYRIVDRHAVDPLVSYYSSRLISQVTVEALKACTQVKDNPRH